MPTFLDGYQLALDINSILGHLEQFCNDVIQILLFVNRRRRGGRGERVINQENC